jgi:cyclopropane-fatty-acyl-phospholipid synthase
MPKQSEQHVVTQYNYEPLPVEEDAERAKSHYEHDPQFYYYHTGGEWNVYSSLYWPHENATGTEAQEAKLDILARWMDLKPGMRILDVGCGWGGPLTYFCKKYGVTGAGITVSPKQRAAAEQRAARYGVDAKFHLTHWQDFYDERGFDAIYSDEVIVHFLNLGEFFAHCWKMLKMNGRFVHKELHYTHHRHSIFGRTGEHVYKNFGESGRYRILADELQNLNDSGFELVHIDTIPMEHYRKTMDYWLNNLHTHRDELKQIAGDEAYSTFRKYLKIMRAVFNTKAMTLDVVVSEKIDPDEHP